MTEYSPEKEGYDKKGYTPKQKYVLQNVITVHGGDAIEAAKAAGYKNPYEAVRQLAEELVALADDVMVRYALQAAVVTGHILTSDEPIVQANEKLKAAKEILEHVKPKVTKVEHSGEVKGGILILPNKKAIEDPDE